MAGSAPLPLAHCETEHRSSEEEGEDDVTDDDAYQCPQVQLVAVSTFCTDKNIRSKQSQRYQEYEIRCGTHKVSMGISCLMIPSM